MRFAAATLLSFVASALAYQVTSPSETKGWTNQGPQTLTWSRVDTDKTNFTVILTNENRAILPTNNQVLAALVDGTSQTTLSVNPPSGGWPLGSGFRVNLVQDEQNTNTIYAQSGQFNITTPTVSSSSGLSSATHA
ncbi:hypothetical protein BDQ12DRAFT_191756 [Crucibulum laeve]|uniref:Yeast cell wall synthesis Kre9/Knh1-like N-terminal domain-containing protein n=1 Tax=Crucibulum laeve TaxID=68775 RepID=A0A5C3MEP5_9AGAR|nr:hypothetical protein BDQ12DRAFT_191756 [Crucibulum laeve]